VTICLIGLNTLVFLYEVMLPAGARDQFILQGALVPYELTRQFGLPVVGDLLTSMFLHGGWLHFLSNMLYLWIFGDNVEDRMGRLPYLLFYLLAGVAASLAQVAMDPVSEIPSIGASGAIAGVLGAYLVMFPRARVRTLVIVFYFIRFVELPAIVVLGMWFILQIFNGVASIGEVATGGVAWFAHIGGFALGLLAGLLFKSMGRSRSYTHVGW
jgi:membrane associated rhomboid family serine protease